MSETYCASCGSMDLNTGLRCNRCGSFPPFAPKGQTMTSPTPEVVEKVARAIAKRLNITPWERLPWSEQRAYLDTAKDALEALGYSRLVEERDALREAIWPFVKAIRCGGFEGWDDMGWPPKLRHWLNLGAIRRLAALQPTQASEGEQ